MGQNTPIGGKTILVVEDEALIRFDLADFFENAGWQVFEAESADEAIELLDRHKEVRVVLTDVQMPGSMDGLRLAHYVRKRFPPTILVVVSGNLRITNDELPVEATFLSKPFDPNRLLLQIETTLVR